MYQFCTYFDRHYLPRGLVLYQSLKAHCPSFRLWVLCLDQETYRILSRLSLSDLRVINLDDFEKGDEQLLAAKQNRSSIEYYFTCTPSLPLYVLKTCPEIDMITYLDADLFFFADPAPLYHEIGRHSVAIIEHRFPPHLIGNKQYGIYNVGWISFRRDNSGLSCLRWWRERCLDWCYDRVEEGRFADQKYLDDWPARFQGVVVLSHKGANLAPWNLGNGDIQVGGNGVLVDGQALIFFHYHGFKRINRWLYNPNLTAYNVKPPRAVLKSIFGPYIDAFAKTAEQVSRLLEISSSSNGIRELGAQRKKREPAEFLNQLIRGTREIVTQSYILSFHGHVL
jgi:hypothetical protein